MSPDIYHQVVQRYSVKESDAAEPLNVLGIRLPFPGPPVGGRVVQIQPPFRTPDAPSYMRVDCSMDPEICPAAGKWFSCHAIASDPKAPFAHQPVVCGKRIEELKAAGADETL